jgi:CRP/FNR family cyclic AMP-dependent transcriptional regulator
MKKARPKNPDLLQNIPLLNGLSASDRRWIAGKVIETRYRKGEAIFKEGDPADYFHIVKEGAVKCVKSSQDGKEVALKVLLPGDLFCCEAAVLDGSSHPGCARPMEDVSILKLSKKAYFEVLRRNPDSALQVIEYLGKRLNEAQENAKVLALGPAEERVAALLVGLASRTGVRDPDGLRLTIHLTRQDIADMAGLTLETAIRVMSRFKRERLVSGTAKRIVILNLPKLQRLAASTPSGLPRPHPL